MRGEKNNHAAYSDFKDKAFLYDVVRRCRNGDTDAMEMVYTGYKTPLFSIAYRFAGTHSLAEDLLHDIFINIFKYIKKLKSTEAFNSWVYRVAINTCMSYARQRKKRKEISLNEINAADIPDPVQQHGQHYLEKAIQSLPPKQKSVLILHDIIGFTHAEIADIMKFSEGTSKSQLFKARMKIRTYLKGDVS